MPGRATVHIEQFDGGAALDVWPGGGGSLVVLVCLALIPRHERRRRLIVLGRDAERAGLWPIDGLTLMTASRIVWHRSR